MLKTHKDILRKVIRAELTNSLDGARHVSFLIDLLLKSKEEQEQEILRILQASIEGHEEGIASHEANAAKSLETVKENHALLCAARDSLLKPS